MIDKIKEKNKNKIKEKNKDKNTEKIDMYEIQFLDFIENTYEYTNNTSDKIPLEKIIKDFNNYFLNIKKINKENDYYDYVINYSLTHLKKDLRKYIKINSRKYNSLPLQNKQFIKCYYDLDTRINKQRGALCKIKYKHNILINN